ncbi:F-box only protein 25 isoform X3 [Pezoporus wallicus]|uniref:F-box only protein 25 isoform X3 n=1 Tax=Pezoporus wallicus TaxID=35540 RepID=UPI00254EBC80|nr:F-box only protein 25 isoform X3 [Pezoporus wallicus]XP_061316686.1 F-box only protein 25 isoform X3 [Pezoporus flaviventris]
MPFLGQDWRSPGWRWIKTEDGWKRCEPFSPPLEDGNNQLKDISHTVIITGDGEDEAIYSTEDCEFAAKKRKKDHCTNNTQCFYREKWIYVHKESTRELLQLIAKSQLTSLSGAAQKNYFNILDKIVRKVMEDQYNPRLIKDLLQDLSSTLCILIRGVGKSVLVGNINIWICRLETILLWQQQLKNLQMNKQVNNGLTLIDLPLHTLRNILHRLSDGWDVITLGQVTPTLYMLSEDRQLWKKLCQYHFAEKQFCRHLIPSEEGHIDWKLMYFALQKYYPIKEQYGDTLHFCRHCSILFWKDYHLALLLKDTGHPCTASDPDTCLMPVSPQHFIDLFKF